MRGCRPFWSMSHTSPGDRDPHTVALRAGYQASVLLPSLQQILLSLSTTCRALGYQMSNQNLDRAMPGHGGFKAKGADIAGNAAWFRGQVTLEEGTFRRRSLLDYRRVHAVGRWVVRLSNLENHKPGSRTSSLWWSSSRSPLNGLSHCT